MRKRPHVVIVGAGFGGLMVAEQLAHVPVEVTLIDRHNYHMFQPLLYQVATIKRGSAVVEFPNKRTLHGPLSYFAWLGVHLAPLSGVRNRRFPSPLPDSWR